MTTPDKLWYLSEHDFFQTFNRLELWAVERQVRMFTCEPGRIFYHEGEPGETLFILKEGTVHLYRLHSDGRKLIVATLTKGAVFGEMGLLGQRMYHTFAEAATPCRICVMGHQDVEALLLRKPQMALHLMRILSDRLADAERQLEQLAFTDVAARLAARLLALATPEGAVDGVSHQVLAEQVGTHRETISATLSTFRAQGLVETGRKHIRLLDPATLESLAQDIH